MSPSESDVPLPVLEGYQLTGEEPTSPWLKGVGVVLSATGFLVTVAAVLAVLWIMFGYFMSCAQLAPGTGVRPMGVTFFMGMVGFGSLVIGLPLSALGSGLCKKTQHRSGETLGTVGQRLSLVALPLGPVLMLFSDLITGVVQAP
jgi:hypothetical protein